MIRNCLREGKPYPKAIANAPDLLPEAVFYYVAYQHLTTCRYYEYGRIPYTVVRDYAEEYELDDEQKEGFFIVIEQLDLRYLTGCMERARKGAKGGKNRRP